MSAPRIHLSLEGHGRVYQPGETLRGHFSVQGVVPRDVRAIELSVLWHTHGKGDEDMSVHHFERIELAGGDASVLRQPRHFQSELPKSPLSYIGMIVRICWCVRVRVFVTRGKDLTLETPFQLGTVPTPQSMASSGEA
jgi:hypothetical protein